MSGLAALAAARPLGIPVVLTFHALGVVKKRHQGSKDTSPAARLPLERRLIADADHIVATSSGEVFELLRLGADNHRIKVVPCGVDQSAFRPQGPVESRPDGRYRLVFVGRLVERKGIGNLISALSDVPDTDLVVVGGPDATALDREPEVRRLRELARECGVAKRVSFRGRVERAGLPALYRSADVVACVPWYESFSIVALEAMACGVPVVASAVGGLIDTVGGIGPGVHVPPRDPTALAAALRTLLPDATRRQAMGQAGVRRVRARYSWDRVAALTLAAYDDVLAVPVSAPADVPRVREVTS